MTSEFEKEHSPIWCENCDQQGWIFVDDLEGSHFVICKSCNWETSDVWCPKCGMGGGFVRNIDKRPSSWSCPDCRSAYQLANDFYDQPIYLFTETELPLLVRDRIERELQESRPSFQESFWQTTRAVITVIALLAIGLLPMALVFTPLPWSIPGFITTLMVFAVWWWFMGKGIKMMRERSAKAAPK